MKLYLGFRITSALAVGLLCQSAAGQSTIRVSVNSAGREANDGAGGDSSSISANGRFVVFSSSATNLVAGYQLSCVVEDCPFRGCPALAPCGDAFAFDRETGTTEIVSVASDGTQGNGPSYAEDVSADGRYVAFTSYATNLVPNDTNGVNDLFLRDRWTGVTERLTDGNGYVYRASMSADARFVAFDSGASNQVQGDTNGVYDVFVLDRLTGQVTRVSVDSMGSESNSNSYSPRMSADGRWVAFESGASNLVAGDANGSFDVFVHDLQTAQTSRVSVTSSGLEGNSTSAGAAISADGRFVAFISSASNLVTGDANGASDAFIHDRLQQETTRISVSSTGIEGDGPSGVDVAPAISADGRFVAFKSFATNLVPDDQNGRPGTGFGLDIFLRDRSARETTRISVDSFGRETHGLNYGDFAAPSLSADGRFTAFVSSAPDLVPNDSNGAQDVFVRDREPCGAGTVNAGTGLIVDVLRANGQTGVLRAAVGAPLELTLDAAPLGPRPARYVLWVWRGLPSNQIAIGARGLPIGCTVNPTPLERGLRPQPLLCLRGVGIPPRACGGAIDYLRSAPDAPWRSVLNRGVPRPALLTLQGALEDAGASNVFGFSVTNAVVLAIE